MVEAYFRNGVRVYGEWQYNPGLCMDDFHKHFPNVAFIAGNFYHCMKRTVAVFRETCSIQHKKEARRSSVRIEELVANVREIIQNTPKNCIRRLSQEIPPFIQPDNYIDSKIDDQYGARNQDWATWAEDREPILEPIAIA